MTRRRKPKPMTLAQLRRKLRKAAIMWGEDMMIGVSLSGSPVIMPIEHVVISESKQRVTIVADFSDAGQRHKAELV